MKQRPGPMGTPGLTEPPRPPADLLRVGDWLVLTVAVPGCRAEDFRVTLLGDRQVQIEGVLPYRRVVPREQLALSEWSYEPFSRTVPLPFPVVVSGVESSFRHGLFVARLPIVTARLPVEWVGGVQDSST